ncbi:MAG: hypothetical protein ABEI07_00675 [Candidatus Nanohaloarchaea archaeon]
MGLFDRIKGSEEEVELKPAERERSYSFGERETGEEESDEEFILPGMKSAADDSSSSSSRRSSSTEGKDDRVERLIEQNERIIELLEEMAGTGSDEPDADIDSVL